MVDRFWLRPSQPMYSDTSKEAAHAQAKDRLAKNVRRLRKDRGLSQEALGLRLDSDQAYIGRIEGALLNPTLESVAEIAHALGVEVPELFR